MVARIPKVIPRRPHHRKVEVSSSSTLEELLAIAGGNMAAQLNVEVWHENEEVYLEWYEPENDDEYEARVSAIMDAEKREKERKKAEKALREERDKLEYERLRKKFGEKL